MVNIIGQLQIIHLLSVLCFNATVQTKTQTHFFSGDFLGDSVFSSPFFLLSDLLLRRRRNDSLSDFLKDLRLDIALSPVPVRSARRTL